MVAITRANTILPSWIDAGTGRLTKPICTSTWRSYLHMSIEEEKSLFQKFYWPLYLSVAVFLVYLCLCLSLCYSEQMLQLSLCPVDDHRSSSALAPSTWLACWLAYFHILCFVKVFRYKIFSLSWFFMERFLISFVCFRILNQYSLYIT